MTSRTAWLRSRLTHRVNGAVQSRIRTGGIDVPSREWDTLVVLDACRYDLFAEERDRLQLDSCRSVTSRGSSTDEWLRRAWTDEYPDTVYVAGNPLVSRHAPDRWHSLDDVWRDAWNPDAGTIPPEPVTQAAIDAHDEYPRKRVVVHYLQPHAPLLDDAGGYSGWQSFRDLDHAPGGYQNVWEAAGDGVVDRDDVWRRYRRTLRRVIGEVPDLLDWIDGRVVVTSDHGNLLGERGWPLPIKQWGHPPGLRQPGVRRVPWAVRDGDCRDVVDDGISSTTGDGPEKEQLRALGYLG